MKQLLILLLAVMASCTSQESAKEQEDKKVDHNEETIATIPLNNGSKWKADEVTKKNVAAMVQLVNDSSFQDSAKRERFSASLQEQVDTLIKQCRMKGPEHDALHVWLEKVLKDSKEMKEKDGEYGEAHAKLKKDIESFYDFFE